MDIKLVKFLGATYPVSESVKLLLDELKKAGFDDAAIEEVFLNSSSMAEKIPSILAELTKNPDFDLAGMKRYDMRMSKNILARLEAAPDKKSVLTQAYVFCPFLSDVYVEAVRSCLLDLDTYETAEYFGLSERVLDEISSVVSAHPDDKELTAGLVSVFAGAKGLSEETVWASLGKKAQAEATEAEDKSKDKPSKDSEREAKEEAAEAKRREKEEAAVAKKKAKEEAAEAKKKAKEEAAEAKKRAREEAAKERKREKEEIEAKRRSREQIVARRKAEAKAQKKAEAEAKRREKAEAEAKRRENAEALNTLTNQEEPGTLVKGVGGDKKSNKNSSKKGLVLLLLLALAALALVLWFMNRPTSGQGDDVAANSATEKEVDGQTSTQTGEPDPVQFDRELAEERVASLHDSILAELDGENVYEYNDEIELYGFKKTLKNTTGLVLENVILEVTVGSDANTFTKELWNPDEEWAIIVNASEETLVNDDFVFGVEMKQFTYQSYTMSQVED